MYLVAPVNVIVEKSSSQRKSATQFAPQKYVSLITDKFPKQVEAQLNCPGAG